MLLICRAQVVGWPPVRSYRKNMVKTCKYVKVAVDGAPYLRKVDLEIYTSYQQLLAALEDMFTCFTICKCINKSIFLFILLPFFFNFLEIDFLFLNVIFCWFR